MPSGATQLLLPVWLGNAPELEDLPRGSRLPLDRDMSHDSQLIFDAFRALGWTAQVVHFGGGEIQLMLTHPVDADASVATVLARAYGDEAAFRAITFNGVSSETYALVGAIDEDGIPDELYSIAEAIGDAGADGLDQRVDAEESGQAIAEHLRGLSLRVADARDDVTPGSYPNISETMFDLGD